MHQRTYVSYISLSTLDAEPSSDTVSRQRSAAAAYLRDSGGRLIDEVLDVGAHRSAHENPALSEALELCRRGGATLLIAELDRMSRDCAFLLTLRRALDQFGMRFVAADMPEANEVTLGIMSAIAEAESAGIRSVGDACAPRKREFLIRLADRHLSESPAQPASADAEHIAPCKPRTLEQAARIAPLLAEIRAAGATTFEQVAYALNELGIPSARGVRWYPSQVRRVEKRIASLS